MCKYFRFEFHHMYCLACTLIFTSFASNSTNRVRSLPPIIAANFTKVNVTVIFVVFTVNFNFLHDNKL